MMMKGMSSKARHQRYTSTIKSIVHADKSATIFEDYLSRFSSSRVLVLHEVSRTFSMRRGCKNEWSECGMCRHLADSRETEKEGADDLLTSQCAMCRRLADSSQVSVRADACKLGLED